MTGILRQQGGQPFLHKSSQPCAKTEMLSHLSSFQHLNVTHGKGMWDLIVSWIPSVAQEGF